MAIDIETTRDLVMVKLSGLDRVFALKSRLEIPVGKINSVAVMPRRDVPYGGGTWIRYPGTYIPRLIRHGSYGLGADREFWAVYRQDDVLVISIHDWHYKTLVLGTSDPAVDAMRLSQFA